MSKKEKGWAKIIKNSSISEEIDIWLNNNYSTIVFEVSNSIFKELNLKPVKLIPHYHKNELPKIFIDNNLEILRNKVGTCLLVKRDKIEHSLFGKLSLEYSKVLYLKEKMINNSLLLRSELLNEDNYFFLSQRMNILNNYLLNYVKIQNIGKLELCGRFQGSVSAKILIGNEIISLEKTNYEIDHVLENDKYIIIIELKKKFYKTQSIHQLIFPLLKFKDDPREKILIYFESSAKSGIKYRLYQLKIKIENSLLRIDSCFFNNGVEYIIKK